MLRDNVPEFVAEVSEMSQLFDVEQPELEAVESNSNAMLNEFFVDSFTEKTATLWEVLFGFLPAPSWDIERRRARVYSRMITTSPMTVATIKDVVEKMCGTEVEVTCDPDEQIINIKFVGTLGVTPYLDDVKKEIELIRPFHLPVIYEFVYRTYGEVGQYTHAQLAAYTHKQIREGELN